MGRISGSSPCVLPPPLVFKLRYFGETALTLARPIVDTPFPCRLRLRFATPHSNSELLAVVEAPSDSPQGPSCSAIITEVSPRQHTIDQLTMASQHPLSAAGLRPVAEPSPIDFLAASVPHLPSPRLQEHDHNMSSLAPPAASSPSSQTSFANMDEDADGDACLAAQARATPFGAMVPSSAAPASSNAVSAIATPRPVHPVTLRCKLDLIVRVSGDHPWPRLRAQEIAMQRGRLFLLDYRNRLAARIVQMMRAVNIGYQLDEPPVPPRSVFDMPDDHAWNRVVAAAKAAAMSFSSPADASNASAVAAAAVRGCGGGGSASIQADYSGARSPSSSSLTTSMSSSCADAMNGPICPVTDCLSFLAAPMVSCPRRRSPPCPPATRPVVFHKPTGYPSSPLHLIS